jgi:hypothetical protein
MILLFIEVKFDWYACPVMRCTLPVQDTQVLSYAPQPAQQTASAASVLPTLLLPAVLWHADEVHV